MGAGRSLLLVGALGGAGALVWVGLRALNGPARELDPDEVAAATPHDNRTPKIDAFAHCRRLFLNGSMTNDEIEPCVRALVGGKGYATKKGAFVSGGNGTDPNRDAKIRVNYCQDVVDKTGLKYEMTPCLEALRNTGYFQSAAGPSIYCKHCMKETSA